jgi:hypothetical protein
VLANNYKDDDPEVQYDDVLSDYILIGCWLEEPTTNFYNNFIKSFFDNDKKDIKRKIISILNKLGIETCKL